MYIVSWLSHLKKLVNRTRGSLLTYVKSAPTYEKWWRRYYEYASGRGVPVEDVTSFMNWLCDMKERDQFAPTTIITAGSCVNSRIKLEYNKNFMVHMLVKDIIKKLQKAFCPKQAAIFSKENIDNFVINSPETYSVFLRRNGLCNYPHFPFFLR